jgi:hypothetical protein
MLNLIDKADVVNGLPGLEGRGSRKPSNMRSKGRISQAVLRNGKTCIHPDVQTLFFLARLLA